jgi:hypothetical protein
VECDGPVDCSGYPGGEAFVDPCGVCVGGDTGLEACVVDCNDIPGGSAYEDACGTCDDNPDNDCCVSMPYVEMADGNVWVETGCDTGDYDCQAEAMCEWVTGVDCIYQEYTCSGDGGSYYPEGTPGGSQFNFAFTYDFSGEGVIEEGGEYVEGGYGNICACDTSYCDLYGLDCSHDYCGVGHWGLDADAIECGAPLDCNNEPAGTAFVDGCGVCSGGTTGLIPCEIDCAGVWGGIAYLDDCGTCDDNPGNDCLPDGGCNSMPYVEMAEGLLWVETSCEPGDYYCQARVVCEAVTGTTCIYQEYDCVTGDSGAFYPEGTPGGSNFNFAIPYDFNGSDIVEEGGSYGGYGNICACDFSYCDVYGLDCSHDGCGYGHWGLDADGVECDGPIDCSGYPGGDAYIDECSVCVGGDTGLEPCVVDCAGVWGGTASEDVCGTCDDNPDNDCCASLPYVEMASGIVQVGTECAPGDYDCQAKDMCEWVTGVNCIYQDYDCATGGAGSYYPEGTPGDSTFNFAITYDFNGSEILEEGGAYGGYGNICACDTSYCDLYDLSCPHSYCGVGHWGLDMDGDGCP